MDRFTRALPGTPLQHAKGSSVSSVDDSTFHSYKKKKQNEFGLVGLVNVGNSCYMNATLQALSNCPPFRQYFIDCHQSGSTQSRAADVLSTLFQQIWTSERHPGHLSPRRVSSAMKNKMFKGILQQDAQEFLRCLLSQVHEEIGLLVPPALENVSCGCGQETCDCGCHRDSSISCASHDSETSNDSNTKLVGASPNKQSRSPSSSPKSPLRGKGSYSKLKGGSKTSLEMIRLADQEASSLGESKDSLGSKGSVGVVSEEAVVKWSEGEVFVVDIDTNLITVHSPQQNQSIDSNKTDVATPTSGVNEATPTSPLEPMVEVKGETPPTPACKDGTSVDCEDEKVVLREKTKKNKHHVVSIVSQVFEGVLESKVTCSFCKKVSVTHEPFHDLSLPIPGRKEMAKFNQTLEDSSEDTHSIDEESGRGKGSALSRGFCSVLSFVTTLTRDLITGPPTSIGDCLNAFFDACELKGDNKYFCCHCKSFQNSKKQMKIVKLPEVLCVHLKRFRFDTYFSTKISRHISFPLTDLDMTGYLRDKVDNNQKYNLDAIITHYGGAGGGHYVAFARNALRNSWYEFNDTRVHSVSADAVQSAEGYVLFYRKVPPPTSLSAQNMDITDLLPRQGTTLPSPDVCYLSRHWLHLARHCANPGPIFQHEYACRHGWVIPSRGNTVRQLSMAVRREMWEKLQEQYKGGPLVPRLEACQHCQEKDLFLHTPYNLEQLTAKRNKEREQVHQVQQNEKQRGTKTEPYLLNIEWLQKWQRFIQCTTLDVLPPGPIDNTPLVRVGGADNALRLVDSASCRKLSPAAWLYFYEVYRGGPTMVTSLEAVSPEAHPT